MSFLFVLFVWGKFPKSLKTMWIICTRTYRKTPEYECNIVAFNFSKTISFHVDSSRGNTENTNISLFRRTGSLPWYHALLSISAYDYIYIYLYVPVLWPYLGPCKNDKVPIPFVRPLLFRSIWLADPGDPFGDNGPAAAAAMIYHTHACMRMNGGELGVDWRSAVCRQRALGPHTLPVINARLIRHDGDESGGTICRKSRTENTKLTNVIVFFSFLWLRSAVIEGS